MFKFRINYHGKKLDLHILKGLKKVNVYAILV